MNKLQSIQLDPDKMVIHSMLDDGRALQSQWTRQSKGPAAESEGAFLQRMAEIITERVASTQELNGSNDPDYRDDCLLGYPPVEPEPDVPEDPTSGWVALRDEPTEPPREW